MNKKKTNVKGFTLIELIVVLAIFSVIMTLVMSFIDPVSKLMTKTSLRERTSAYVDNIGEYISKSIRSAQNIHVYEHGLYNEDYDADDDLERKLVRDFIDDYYDGAIDEKGNSLTGKVHVLKLINTDDGSLKAGRIYESVYNFTAGCGIPKTVYFNPVSNSYVPDSEFSGKTNEEIEQYIKDKGYTALEKSIFATDDKHSQPVIESENISVINEEHFKDYSYYYQLGMHTFDPITDTGSYTGLVADSRYFYSRLNKAVKNGSAIGDSINEYQFVMNVVSFKNNNKYDSKVNSVYTTGEGASAVTENVVAFLSPAAMDSVGMTLKNAQMQKESNSVKYYRKKLDSSGNVVQKDGKEVIDAVRGDNSPKPFKRITDGTSDNIYMIFTVPSEINDAEWKLSKDAPTTAPTT